MAIVKLGPLVSAVSGTIGSTTFVAGPGPTVVRTNPRKKRQLSEAALLAKSRITTQMRAWGALSDEYKAAWRNAALQYTFKDPLGTARHLSGFQLWVKMRTYETTYVARTSFPDGSQSSGLATFTFDADQTTAGYHIHATYYALESANILLYGLRTLSTVQARRHRGWKWIGSYAAQPASVNFNARWIELFGEQISGEFVEVRAITISLNKFPSPPRTDFDWSF